MIQLLGFAFGAISAVFVIPLAYSVVKAFLGIAPSGHVEVTPPIQEVIDAGGGEYFSEGVHVPKLTGCLLSFFSHFLWTPFGRKWVLNKLLRDNRLFDTRERYVPEAATFYPTPPFVPFPEQTSREEERSEEDQTEALINSPPSRSSGSSSDKQEQLSDSEFVFPSMIEYLHAYQSGRVTPAVVAERIIESIRASDSLSPPLRAFVQWNETEIRRQAEESTRRYTDRDSIRPLEGVPVAVKESISTKPYILRVGSVFLPRSAQSLVNQESEVVLRLRRAGAVIIGASNLHEFGFGGTGSNVNKLHQTARNPYDVNRYPGGSSSGSGAAVASGLVPLALGTDGGGSVRIPAALSGFVALKATFGRVSEGRMIPSASTLTNIGPMCTSVADTALSYLLLAGPDPTEPCGVQQGPVTIGRYLTPNDSVKGLKVGIYRAWFNHSDPDVLAACEKALQWIEEAGAELVDVHIPEINATFNAHVITFLTEVTSTYGYDLFDHYRDINCDSREFMAFAGGISSADYTVAGRQRTRAIQVMKSVFSQVDIIVTPSAACTAPLMSPEHTTHGYVDLPTTKKLVRYTLLGNMTGVPAIAIPVGYDSNKLPISLQLMASWWREDLLFMLASQIEKRVAKRKPIIFYDILRS